MSWQCSAASNAGLVENLVRHELVRTPAVEAAMRAVDRAHYCPAGAPPYEDAPQRIGFAATISAPHMHALALEELGGHLARPGARVLDVGCGSGYLAAVMGRMVEAGGGRVVAIDYLEGLTALSAANLGRADADLLQGGRVVCIVTGDGWQGVADAAPFDAIHVGAAAASVPAALVAQLKPDGRMVIPVGPEHGDQSLARVELDAQGRQVRTELMGVRYVPLIPQS